jgi:peptide/nickel transport system permease protein
VLRYILRRLLTAIPLLVGVSVVGFALMQLAPGGPFDIYLENPSVTPEVVDRIKAFYGLDQPWYIQYIKWAKGMLTFNFGFSFRGQRPVLDLILERLPATLELMLAAYFLAIVVGVLVGFLGAIRRNSLWDYLATSGAMLALSFPTFWLGLMFMFLFAEKLRWFPSGGISTIGMDFNLQDRISHLVLPALVLGLVLMAEWSRYTRAAMLEVINADYMRTARSKGLPEWMILGRHAFRNAVIPLITLAGIQFPIALSGALVVETLFSWPGIGRLFYDTMTYRDYPVMMGLLMFTSVAVILGNILADVLITVADPRIRLG